MALNDKAVLNKLAISEEKMLYLISKYNLDPLAKIDVQEQKKRFFLKDLSFLRVTSRFLLY